MTEELKDILEMFKAQARHALHTSGRKAVASAIRSVTKDGRRFVAGVDKGLGRVLERLDLMAPDEEDGEKGRRR